MIINDFLFLLSIPKQDLEISSFSRSELSLPGRGHVLVRCSNTITGLRTPFLFLQFLDLFWNSLVPFTLFSFSWSTSIEETMNMNYMGPFFKKGPKH